jgi:predicted Zn-dependent peptidase
VARDQLPPPGPAPKIALPVPERMRLSNGIKVLLVPRRTMPVVAMAMVWPVGALEDPADRPGMAHLVADMLDEGAGTLGPIELADALARLGARLSTGASFNATFVNVQTLARNFDATLKLFADVVRRPAFSDKELERVKSDTITYLRQRHDVPANIASDLFEEALYGERHRRRAPAIGTAEAVALLDKHDLRWWHRERLRPDDGTLIVVGDVDPGQLKAKLEAELGGWKAPTGRKDQPGAPVVAAPVRKVVAAHLPGKTQVVLSIGEPSVPRNHPDYFPLLVMNAVLGGQFNSRINMNLREKHGYAYGSRSEFTFARDGGPFLIQASVKGETVKAAVAEVLREVAAIRSGDVGADELQQAKDYLARSLARRFETTLQVATELAVIEIFSLPDSYLSTYADRVQAVSAADVRRVALQYLDPARMSLALVGDRKDIDRVADLNLGPIEYRTLKAENKAPRR